MTENQPCEIYQLNICRINVKIVKCQRGDDEISVILLNQHFTIFYPDIRGGRSMWPRVISCTKGTR